MELIFLPEAEDHLEFWKKSGNKTIQKKIDLLLRAILENPFEGIGKPEALKHKLSGLWSRRIDREHRIVYEVENKKIKIHALKFHY